MKKRVTSALIGALIVIGMIAVGGPLYFFGVLVFALIAYNEILHSFKASHHQGFVIICNIMVVIQFIMTYLKLNIPMEYYFIGCTFILLSMTVFFESILTKDVINAIFGLIYPVIPLLMLAKFGYELSENRIYLILLILVNSWSADIFAYLTGIKFGKHQLSPKISPKKTIEGSIGGLVGALVLALIMGVIYNVQLGFNIPLYHFIVMGGVSGVLSQIGDLIASKIKRFNNIKDFGKIMPGHGGIMDRIDSLVLVSVVSILYIKYFIF